MFGDKEVEAILQGIYDLNTMMGIWGIIIPVIFAVVVIVLVYQCYKHPGKGNTKKTAYRYDHYLRLFRFHHPGGYRANG